jgi:hypothetical protein
MANVFPLGIGRVVADDMSRALPVERSGASDEARHDDLPCDSHDLAATQGAHALRLARLYLASARMSCSPPDTSAERDKARAECLFQWAKGATHNTTAAGGCLLNAELALLKADLDAFDLAGGAGTHLICVSSDPHHPEVGSAMASASRRRRSQSASDAPQAARLLRINR